MFTTLLVIAQGCSAPLPAGANRVGDGEPDPGHEAETDGDPDLPGETADTATACAPSVEIGAGEVAWLTLAPDDEVVMVHGPQGGWHVLWSARVSGLQPTLQLRGIITDTPSDTVVSEVTYNVALTPLDTCVGESVGQYGYLDVGGLAIGSLDTPPELLVGHALSLRIEATDFQGGSAAAEIRVTATPDATDVD